MKRRETPYGIGQCALMPGVVAARRNIPRQRGWAIGT